MFKKKIIEKIQKINYKKKIELLSAKIKENDESVKLFNSENFSK